MYAIRVRNHPEDIAVIEIEHRKYVGEKFVFAIGYWDYDLRSTYKEPK